MNKFASPPSPPSTLPKGPFACKENTQEKCKKFLNHINFANKIQLKLEEYKINNLTTSVEEVIQMFSFSGN